jgi:hypothetical protein
MMLFIFLTSFTLIFLGCIMIVCECAYNHVQSRLSENLERHDSQEINQQMTRNISTQTNDDGKTLSFARIKENAKIPERCSEGAVGWDFSSIEDISIEAGGRKAIDTGIG